MYITLYALRCLVSSTLALSARKYVLRLGLIETAVFAARLAVRQYVGIRQARRKRVYARAKSDMVNCEVHKWSHCVDMHAFADQGEDSWCLWRVCLRVEWHALRSYDGGHQLCFICCCAKLCLICIGIVVGCHIQEEGAGVRREETDALGRREQCSADCRVLWRYDPVNRGDVVADKMGQQEQSERKRWDSWGEGRRCGWERESKYVEYDHMSNETRRLVDAEEKHQAGETPREAKVESGASRRRGSGALSWHVGTRRWTEAHLTSTLTHPELYLLTHMALYQLLNLANLSFANVC
ncbi:hypothetical protein EJ04DRAFT_523599 [Polyplosphaeria fusca]|uniref:Uncharacterized protein n=1 Tax=Polyplosphaeria fusca TaxID=682080 RepID=A0A9P4R0X4_9PLEO|nr:hypothetical protein EJ04DRAFT_523599 [Polyplosphaeria fusca]